jgi:hypothetical protein
MTLATDVVAETLDGLLHRSTELRLQHVDVTDRQADVELRAAAQLIISSAATALRERLRDDPMLTTVIVVQGFYRRAMTTGALQIVRAFELVDVRRVNGTIDRIELFGYLPDVALVAAYGQTVVEQLELAGNWWWLQHPQQGQAAPMESYRQRRQFIHERTQLICEFIRLEQRSVHTGSSAARALQQLDHVRARRRNR